ncbi:uncharacterized protein LOC144440655 [Glandiceps talaboti]
MVWNVRGLNSKLQNVNFISFCEEFDIFGLVETWTKENDSVNVFENFVSFKSPAVNLSEKGRASGGVEVFVNKNLVKGVKRITTSLKNTVILLLQKNVFHFLKDVLMVITYVPPEGSRAYVNSSDDGVENLENHLGEILSHLNDDVSIIIAGDLNARTGSMQEFIEYDDSKYGVGTNYESNDFTISRSSLDEGINNFGLSLISLCKHLTVYMLNGRKEGTGKGEFTCIANEGRSVVDYVIVSEEIFSNVNSFVVPTRDESDHFPICCSFTVKVNFIRKTHAVPITNFRWCNELLHEYQEKLSCNENVQLMYHLTSNDVNINEAVTGMTNILKNAAGNMLKENKGKNQGTRSGQVWFDAECKLAKTKRLRALRRFRSTGSEEDYCQYKEENNYYKNLLRCKKRKFEEKIHIQIRRNMNDETSFWKVVKLTKRGKRVQSLVTLDEWIVYFSELFRDTQSQNRETENFTAMIETFLQELTSNDIEHATTSGDNDDSDILNCTITNEDILKAIGKLKNNKSAGPDMLIPELFKYTTDNSCYHSLISYSIIGIFPNSWSVGTIVPIFKKNEPCKPENYRAISLLSIFSKVFTSILNERIKIWAKQFNIVPECQAGFREGYSTVDNFFTLYATLQKSVSVRGKKLYCLYVDFEKAFDSVDRTRLLYRLVLEGINGKMYQILKAMYADVKSSVREGNVTSECFALQKGVRQGCMLSPILFSLYINELEKMMKNSGLRGIQFLPNDMLELFLLLYADDIAILSNTVVGSKRLIDVLYDFTLKWKMKVNLAKTKVVVHRNGGYLSRHEKWYFGGTELKIASAYEYLGLVLSCKGSLSVTTRNMAVKARKKLAIVGKSVKDLKFLAPKIYFRLFDVLILPVLSYGSEVWGFMAYEHLERVQLLYCRRRYLGVANSAPNCTVLGECEPLLLLCYKLR